MNVTATPSRENLRQDGFAVANKKFLLAADAAQNWVRSTRIAFLHRWCGGTWEQSSSLILWLGGTAQIRCTLPLWMSKSNLSTLRCSENDVSCICISDLQKIFTGKCQQWDRHTSSGPHGNSLQWLAAEQPLLSDHLNGKLMLHSFAHLCPQCQSKCRSKSVTQKVQIIWPISNQYRQHQHKVVATSELVWRNQKQTAWFVQFTNVRTLLPYVFSLVCPRDLFCRRKTTPWFATSLLVLHHGVATLVPLVLPETERLQSVEKEAPGTAGRDCRKGLPESCRFLVPFWSGRSRLSSHDWRWQFCHRGIVRVPLELLHSMVEEKKKEMNYATTSNDTLFERLLVIFGKNGSGMFRNVPHKPHFRIHTKLHKAVWVCKALFDNIQTSDPCWVQSSFSSPLGKVKPSLPSLSFRKELKIKSTDKL